MTRLERFKFNMVLLKAIIWSYMVDAWNWFIYKKYDVRGRLFVYGLLFPFFVNLFEKHSFFYSIGWFVVFFTGITIGLNWIGKIIDKF